MRKVTIEVTEADIAKGIRVSALRCPVALALKRHPLMKKMRLFGVTGSSAGFTDGFVDYSVRLPWEVARWVDNFDTDENDPHRRVVQPISFEVEIPWD